MPPGRGSSAASVPFHWIIFTGSTKKPNTVSGLASIRTSRSTASVCSGAFTIQPPLLFLGRRRKAKEGVVPELLEERLELCQAFRARLVEVTCADAPLVDQAGGLQHLQMLRDRGPRDIEVG